MVTDFSVDRTKGHHGPGCRTPNILSPQRSNVYSGRFIRTISHFCRPFPHIDLRKPPSFPCANAFLRLIFRAFAPTRTKSHQDSRRSPQPGAPNILSPCFLTNRRRSFTEQKVTIGAMPTEVELTEQFVTIHLPCAEQKVTVDPRFSTDPPSEQFVTIRAAPHRTKGHHPTHFPAMPSDAP